MTPSQIATLLELFPGPARVYDASGAIVAQNERARGGSSQKDGDWEVGVRQDLGDGWHIRTWSKERRDEETERVEKHRVYNAKAPNVQAGTPDISTLANSMAHSIRNPLSSIVTAAGLVRDDTAISEETAMLLGIIKKEANHLNRILTDFLQYVRPQKFQPTVFDLGEAASQTAVAIGRELPENLSIDVEYSLPELPAWGDEVQIRGALWNILRNAGEAMPEGGRLRLWGRVSEGMSILCIEDNGPGFSAEDLQRAFEPFFSNTPEGAGLGLSIARAAIERCAGDIWLENVADDTKNAQDTESAQDTKSAEDTTPALQAGARVCIALHQQAPNESHQPDTLPQPVAQP
ncbi:MAG TPA: HAMP domain-containing sensor histidine kinase [Abditibacteriaceae bacterium]|jgi:signal transduction histidine kinase